MKNKVILSKTYLVGVIIILFVLGVGMYQHKKSIKKEELQQIEAEANPMNEPTVILSPGEKVSYKYTIRVNKSTAKPEQAIINVSDQNREHMYTATVGTMVFLTCAQEFCEHNRIIITPTKGILEFPKGPYSRTKNEIAQFNVVGEGEVSLILSN